MRKIEIFTAGCPVCEKTIEEVRNAACSNCEIEVLNIKESKEAYERSQLFGIKSIPSVVIDGKLADCCSNKGVNIDILKTLGLGKNN